jgi:hypothetical protein
MAQPGDFQNGHDIPAPRTRFLYNCREKGLKGASGAANHCAKELFSERAPGNRMRVFCFEPAIHEGGCAACKSSFVTIMLTKR